MSALCPCPSCSRHVRVVESACPFCGVALVEEAHLPRAMPTHRLGRAALFAFGIAAAAGAPGCGTSTTAGTDAYVGSLDAAYGGPPHDAGTDGGLIAAYGGPPTDSGPTIDAALPDSGTSALYGAPPPPPAPPEH